MAITINEQPDTDRLYPSYNPIQYLLTGSKFTEPNFKIFAYIHEDPSGSDTLVATRRLVPKPGSSGRLIFDTSDVIRNLIDEDPSSLIDNDSGIQDESNVVKQFRVAFREHYGTPSIAQGSNTSGNIFSVNRAAFKFRERFDPNLAQYTIYPNWYTTYEDSDPDAGVKNPYMTAFNNYYGVTGTSIGVDFSAAERFMPIHVGQKMNLRWREDIASIYQRDIQVSFLADDFSVNHALADQVATTTTQLNVASCNIGTAELESLLSFTLGDDDKYMAISLGDSGARYTTFLMYEIVRPCDKYTSYEIHWLNRLGGFDSYVFHGRSYKSQMIERTTYLKNKPAFSGTTLLNDLDAVSVGTHHTSVKERYRVNSKAVKEWMFPGFEDLFSSPLIYWRHPDLGYLQIQLSGDNYEVKDIHYKASNIQFEFMIDDNDIRQRS